MTQLKNTDDENSKISLSEDEICMALDSYVQETPLSQSQKEAIVEFIRHRDLQVQEVRYDCIESIGDCEVVQEVEPSLETLKKIEAYLQVQGVESVREDVRANFLQWSFGLFGVTLLWSGILTGFHMMNPGSNIDIQVVKDWTHTMITAEVGFISGAAGFYFAKKDSSGNRNR